jgi:hypothetical protein
VRFLSVTGKDVESGELYVDPIDNISYIQGFPQSLQRNPDDRQLLQLSLHQSILLAIDQLSTYSSHLFQGQLCQSQLFLVSAFAHSYSSQKPLSLVTLGAVAVRTEESVQGGDIRDNFVSEMDNFSKPKCLSRFTVYKELGDQET